MTGARRLVLNIGCGELGDDSLQEAFGSDVWQEVRFDINPAMKPDIIGELSTIDQVCAPNSFDAIWCSHSLEHLYAHQVDPAVIGMRNVLKEDGFALTTCPDLNAILQEVTCRGLDGEVYRSVAGPITSLDMLFGHGASIAKGNEFMAHRTGFTAQRLAGTFIRSGFETVLVKQRYWDIWGLALKQHDELPRITEDFAQNGFDLFT